MASRRPRILVINPNSNEAVTAGLSAALEPLRLPDGPAIECETLSDGPFGIESQADIDSVVEPLRALVEAREDADAFVIACYSDPGLPVCRQATAKPVLGIQESGALTAITRGARFGVIALSEASIARHLRYLEGLGLLDRLAGERPVSLSVAESADGEGTFERLLETGRLLRDEDDAACIVLGCAGMAGHRAALEDALGLPVIDPTQAAVTMAIGAVLL